VRPTATPSHLFQLRLHHHPAHDFLVFSLGPALGAARLSDGTNEALWIMQLSSGYGVRVLLGGWMVTNLFLPPQFPRS